MTPQFILMPRWPQMEPPKNLAMFPFQLKRAMPDLLTKLLEF